MHRQIILAGLLILPAMASAQLNGAGRVGGTVGAGAPGGTVGSGVPGGSIAGTANAGVGGAVNSTVNGTRTTTPDAMSQGAAGSGLRVDNRSNLVRPGASVGTNAGGATVTTPATGQGADINAATGASTPSAPPPR
ncbi:hypothetical protein [Sphingomonas quercus]|uniref:Uncharacterized protein n=1 Tax=Sphingomonas quercus TaxID=2842451 RepID=A0ABS6BK53_9SPHN|nr:hypothetical protein [Sphingomonas quercus]MBU3078007.1 hypothetical protein [Sphingomonas quercus]